MPWFPLYLNILDIWQGCDYVLGIKYAKVLNMLWYSSCSNIIIIVTNVIIVEFLSALFVDPGCPQLTILSFLIKVRI